MITKPKGTYDILPTESREWAKLEDTIRKICKLYNYKEIRTPIFEAFEVFHRDINDTSDMVTKETYDFKAITSTSIKGESLPSASTPN